MHLSILLAASSMISGALAAAKMFNVDCSTSAGACNNDCYGIYNLKHPSTLDWDKPSTSLKAMRRRASGCKSPSPCGASGTQPGHAAGHECDEYPYASTSQGGVAGASLRCVVKSENGDEGKQLAAFFHLDLNKGGCGDMACQFKLVFTQASKVHFCHNKGGKNDGRQFKWNGTAYNSARFRRGIETEEVSEWVPAETDLDNYFPLHLRREFLLNTGERALVVTRDDTDFVGENTTIASMSGPKFFVRELFGMERSPTFR